MKVLFLQETDGARAGDVKEVSPGYARNFLFPKKLAIVADERVVDQIRQKEEATRRRAEKALTEARDIEARLRRITVTLYSKAGEGGRLFGSVTNADVADALTRIDFKVAKAQVRMPNGPLKTVGEHTVTVAPHTDVIVEVKVVVLGETD